MTPVQPALLGIGVVSTCGVGLNALWKKVLSRKQPEYTIDEKSGLLTYRADAAELKRFMQPRRLRRIDPFLRMALLAAHLAIEDSQLELPQKHRVGVLMGSGHGPLGNTFGFQDSVIDYGEKCGSPLLFANSVHNALSAQISIALGLTGPGHTITAFNSTTTEMFRAAGCWLESQMADYVLVGAGEEVHPVGQYVTQAEGATVREDANYPLDFDACNYRPGEGFVCMLLGRKPHGKAYARIQNIWTGKMEAAGRSLASKNALFLAAQGDAREGRHYKRLTAKRSPAFAHAAYYGSLCTGDIFEIALAARAIRENHIPPEGATQFQKDSLDFQSRERTIDCLKARPDGKVHIVRLNPPLL